jgi:hypothetical protein
MSYKYHPVIVIGAARSGTKLLRDLIAEHPAADKVPYDINYVWRFGNEKVGHDELGVNLINDNIKKRIRSSFASFSTGRPFLIEKTVSNCLRVPFVRGIFPEASFIHLVRHGVDVVESAYRQWLAPPDWRYIFGKAKGYPITEAFGYALSYSGKTLGKVLMRGKGHKNTWGPRYEGIDQDVATKSLLEVCAIQWARCAKTAVRDLRDLPEGRVFTVRYEKFIQEPLRHLQEIAGFACIDPVPFSRQAIWERVLPENIGKGKRHLSEDQLSSIFPHIKDTMELFGYIEGQD